MKNKFSFTVAFHLFLISLFFFGGPINAHAEEESGGASVGDSGSGSDSGTSSGSSTGTSTGTSGSGGASTSGSSSSSSTGGSTYGGSSDGSPATTGSSTSGSTTTGTSSGGSSTSGSTDGGSGDVSTTDGGSEEVLITYYYDSDDDGYGDSSDSVEALTQPHGYVTDNTDCDDTNPSVYPTHKDCAAFTMAGRRLGGDGIDNDCDGSIDEDNTCGLRSPRFPRIR